MTLFTTVLPLIILGFGYFSGFAENVSIGTLFERQLDLHGAAAQTCVMPSVPPMPFIRRGRSSDWPGFLVFGIPMP